MAIVPWSISDCQCGSGSRRAKSSDSDPEHLMQSTVYAKTILLGVISENNMQADYAF